MGEAEGGVAKVTADVDPPEVAEATPYEAKALLPVLHFARPAGVKLVWEEQ
jgi:hypothetical protein